MTPPTTERPPPAPGKLTDELRLSLIFYIGGSLSLRRNHVGIAIKLLGDMGNKPRSGAGVSPQLLEISHITSCITNVLRERAAVQEENKGKAKERYETNLPAPIAYNRAGQFYTTIIEPVKKVASDLIKGYLKQYEAPFGAGRGATENSATSEASRACEKLCTNLSKITSGFGDPRASDFSEYATELTRARLLHVNAAELPRCTSTPDLLPSTEKPGSGVLEVTRLEAQTSKAEPPVQTGSPAQVTFGGATKASLAAVPAGGLASAGGRRTRKPTGTPPPPAAARGQASDEKNRAARPTNMGNSPVPASPPPSPPPDRKGVPPPPHHGPDEVRPLADLPELNDIQRPSDALGWRGGTPGRHAESDAGDPNPVYRAAPTSPRDTGRNASSQTRRPPMSHGHLERPVMQLPLPTGGVPCADERPVAGGVEPIEHRQGPGRQQDSSGRGRDGRRSTPGRGGALPGATPQAAKTPGPSVAGVEKQRPGYRAIPGRPATPPLETKSDTAGATGDGGAAAAPVRQHRRRPGWKEECCPAPMKDFDGGHNPAPGDGNPEHAGFQRVSPQSC